MKLSGRESKYLLRRAVADLVPAENLSRSKKGFAVPIGQWFRGELREYLADHVLGRRAMERGLFHQATIERLIDEHQAGRADHAHPLWVLLMLELWHREFIDHAPAAMRARGAPAAMPSRGLPIRGEASA
jgi:asparagine synthase (glutamine-hydrolysing)